MAKKDGGASKQAAIARQDEAIRQQGIRDGTQRVNDTFGQFDDAFYDKQKQNFLSFSLPQLEDQYGKAQKELTFSLTRSGNLDSSARGYQEGELQKLYDTNRTSLADQAQTYANQARSNVEDARSSLITTLNATGDATGAVNSANSRAAALSQPTGYSPIGDLFGALTSGLAAQAAQEKAMALSNGAYKSPYNTGLFGSTAGAVKNTA
ncbi:hypothetical protein [Methylobacterium soli]|uniref:Uncharacterized protein n=1 Tax=Methylobacterium soli TaxID=553447 RepID=A0A6L3SRN8_9HYPH|nr:hypothetical protein [Methylobacterium soli]KAB1075399.1 hypothetical protein F6X53_24835 [Methylobacterium soli]GJE43775.1 hypothetical protein AEGHOMDF_2954 [Methylobacterium soli]